VNESQLFSQWSQLWEPPKRLPLSQWAEENFVTSAEYSSSTGKLRLHEYQREPLDCFTDPRVSDIVIKSGTQMLKTLLLQVALAYVAAEDPGPCLLSQCKEDDAVSFSKERLVPMIRDIPSLQAIPGLASKSRTSGSTATYKEFPGGSWSLVGAGTPGNAARRSIRYLFCDEVNKYPPNAEGSFTELAAERTATFGTRAKRVYCCSPTTPDGLISRMYEASDQRKPWVPCPDCGEFQLLKWAQVKWDPEAPREDRPATARYECENPDCCSRWDDLKRWTAASRVEWRAEKPFRGVAGFGDLGHLYSPYKTLAGMVEKWLKIAADKSPEAAEDLRVFINTNLAEEYVEKGDAPEWRKLYDRRESYELRLVPRDGLFLTGFCDVQKDRLEVMVKAWGAPRRPSTESELKQDEMAGRKGVVRRNAKQNWVIDYAVLDGDTSRPEVWAKLTDYLNTNFHHESGVDLPIIKFGIDSGYATTEVYSWARKQGSGRVIVTKGYDTGPIIGIPKAQDVRGDGKAIKRGVKVWPMNVSALKSELYGWLKLERPTEEEMGKGAGYPPGYCHIPEFGDEFFKQHTAEQLITRKVKGFPKPEWVNTYGRNEVLDTAVGNRGVSSAFGMDRWQEAQWAQLEAQITDRVRPSVTQPERASPPSPPPAVEVPPAVQANAGYRERGGWIDRGSGRGWLSR
jgi:phage terminase large subunit GpA-like protein